MLTALLRAVLLVCAFVVSAPLVLLAQTNGRSLNMELLDQLNPDTSSGLHSACWGYTAPDGREYALLGTQRGTSIVDITETPIREVAYIWGPRSPWREMKVYRAFLYVVTESRDSGNGLQIIDLSDLPRSAHLIRTDTSIFTTAHTVTIADHYLFANGTQAAAGANGGAIILDLEPDPTRPRKVGAVTPYYFHDTFVRNDTLLGAAINNGRCDVFDIRNREAPRLITSITYPYAGTHNAELTEDGGYVVTTDEVNFTPKTLKVWDIRDPEEVLKVADFTPSPGDIIHNVHVRGRYAIIAWYTAGIRIVDLIDPRHPREVGYYDTYDGRSGSFEGVWEVFGFFSSGKVIAFDRNTGLYLLRFNFAKAGSISGVVRNQRTGDPLPGVKIDLPGRLETVTTDAAGRYYVGGVNGGETAMRIRQFGYAHWSSVVTIDGDSTADILLDPLEFYRATIRVRSDDGVDLSDFRFAIEGIVPSSGSSNGEAVVVLPRDTMFPLTVGSWGYRATVVPLSIRANGQTITITVNRGYHDNATLDLGWNYQSSDDTTTTGRWVRIVPYLGYIGSGWIHPATEPSGNPRGSIFVTGSPPIGAPPQLGDVNNGTTTLTTPLMDLSAHTDPEIRFDLWSVHYRRDSLDTDSLRIDLSNDSGATWTSLLIEADGREGWRPMAYRVASYLNPTATMLMRVRVSDLRGLSLVNCAMDNFEVTGAPTSAPRSPRADWTIRLTAIPNPAFTTTTIVVGVDIPTTQGEVSLIDLRGRLVAHLYSGAIPSGGFRIVLGQEFPSGEYLVLARTTDGREGTGRVTIVH